MNNRYFQILLPQIIKERILRKGVYQEFYKENIPLFVHTPKTAGTSISKVLYGKDPWHYSVQELRNINRVKFDKAFKFSFVRNPFDRLVSTYNYALKWVEINPGTSIGFLANYSTFEEFIERGLTRELIEKHYFFWPYTKYLFIKNKLSVDKVGKFETLESDFKSILNNPELELPRLNTSNLSIYKENTETYYSKRTKTKVIELYRMDFDNFGYEY